MATQQPTAAPEGFCVLLEQALAEARLSIREASKRAGISPAFLSRILQRERGLPSNDIILRLARALNIRPSEKLLIEAGRTPEDIKQLLTEPLVPEFVRTLGPLTDNDRAHLLKIAQELARRHSRGKDTK